MQCGYHLITALSSTALSLPPSFSRDRGSWPAARLVVLEPMHFRKRTSFSRSELGLSAQRATASFQLDSPSSRFRALGGAAGSHQCEPL